MTWVGNAFLIIGLLLIGSKKRAAFVWTFIGEAIWLVCSLAERRADMAFICFVFGVLAAINWVRWGRAVNGQCGERDRVAGGTRPAK